jgi:hypothetical protein
VLQSAAINHLRNKVLERQMRRFATAPVQF